MLLHKRRYVLICCSVCAADAITIEELDLVSKIPHHVPISANHLWNLDELLERIWEYLGMIRIYTKPKCEASALLQATTFGLAFSSSRSLPSLGLARLSEGEVEGGGDFDGCLDLSVPPACCCLLPPVCAALCLFRGAIPDYEQPVVMKRDNPTVENFCNRLHKHILEKFKYALVWGSSVKHQPQRVGVEHVLMDEDVVQIVKK
jgi:ribosome-interacting GTPase 1